MYPPPGMKKLNLRSMWHFGSGWCTPPPRNEKVGSQVNVIYWFWMMYAPMNAIENYWGQQVFFTNLPPPHSIILFYAWTGNWWISISIEYGYIDSNTICHPSPDQKLKCSFLDYVQLLMIGQAGQWTQTPSATPLQPKKWNVHFWITFNFWWLAKQSEQKMSTKPLKKWKRPLSHQKIKCSFLDYIQLLMISWAIRAKNINQTTQKTEKGPLSHQKIKCLFLDYVQLLMISWSIWAENFDQNTKKWKRPPKSLKNKMFIFGLCSTSDDGPSGLSKKC